MTNELHETLNGDTIAERLTIVISVDDFGDIDIGTNTETLDAHRAIGILNMALAKLVATGFNAAYAAKQAALEEEQKKKVQLLVPGNFGPIPNLR